ncbi:MAG: hypothetical protein AB7P07_03555 [Hyphomonadaceae bacterium]
MRFALIATGAAAIAALPMVVAVSTPQMNGQAFVQAVRCTAFESVVDNSRDVAAQRYALNLEAQRQPAETTHLAQAEARAATREAADIVNAGDTVILGQTMRAACSGGAVLANGARAPGAA